MNKRQFLVELDLEAKKYADWLHQQNLDGIDLSSNVLDILDQNSLEESSVFEKKMVSVRNKLLQLDPSADPFLLGISFITLALRHFHLNSLNQYKEEDELERVRITVKNLVVIKSILSNMDTTSDQHKELLQDIKPAIQIGFQCQEYLQTKGELTPEEGQLLGTLLSILPFYTEQLSEADLL